MLAVLAWGSLPFVVMVSLSVRKFAMMVTPVTATDALPIALASMPSVAMGISIVGRCAMTVMRQAVMDAMLIVAE